ncbi:MAG: nitrile hydratase accessory protein [Gammaproteobacteria bacterium]|nr:nitrile hydratase accessory protein [Gammaproteobacteria bacterium]
MNAELSGMEEPPMANGELIFEAPWQATVFGMARALSEAGLYDWDEFRGYLIRTIALRGREDEGDYAYYDHFLTALETLLADRGFVSPESLQARCREFRERPHGHDH